LFFLGLCFAEIVAAGNALNSAEILKIARLANELSRDAKRHGLGDDQLIAGDNDDACNSEKSADPQKWRTSGAG
jgi:hypothetical protein